MAETETRTHITQVGTVIVPVTDQDRALEFYLGKLGFEQRMDVPYGEGERWVEVLGTLFCPVWGAADLRTKYSGRFLLMD